MENLWQGTLLIVTDETEWLYRGNESILCS